MTTTGAQAGAVFPAERLHWNTQQCILAYRLGQIKNVMFINRETAGLVRQSGGSPANRVPNREILLFNIQHQGKVKQAQAATAANFHPGVQGPPDQDTTVGTHQPDPALDRAALTIADNIHGLA